MKKFCLICSVLLMGSVSAGAQDLVERPAYSGINQKYLSFDDIVGCEKSGNRSTRCPSGQELVWQEQEIERWKSAICKAADMLPSEFFKEIIKETGNVNVSWTFIIARKDWAVGFTSLRSVYINLLSNYKNIPKWLSWEPFRKNGLTEPERVFVALHEIGHLSGGSFDWTSYSQYQGISEENENAATLYGKERGEVEDFAESFALYVMWPEYLKENFPKHYEAIKKVFVREYESVYPMPNSIKSRLTVK